MNHFTTAITTFGTATSIVLGGLIFAPIPIIPAGPPTTAIPVELQDRGGSPLNDGEVTTISYRVDYRKGVPHAGSSVSTSTKATFTANLPNGEYLIKTVVGANSGLWPIRDIDGTSPVPAGSGCANRFACTWVVVSNNTWVIKGGTGQPHPVAIFNLDRTKLVPTTTGVQVPTAPPKQVSLPSEPVTTAPRGQLDDSPKQGPKVAIPAAPAAPVVTAPRAAEQAPVATTPAPVVTQPEPVTTVPEPVATVPAPVATVPEPVVTVPETVPAPEPQSRLGCDESNDPEIQALLWTNDGAIRWMEDGEMITLYPEAGMDPIEVCLDAYHRLTELGIDIDFYTVK